MNVLLIVASGKSSRFGGFPKALCKIGNLTNVENTIYFALKVFDKVYVAVNEKLYSLYLDTLKDVDIFSIITGQGEAHSLLKCLKLIREKENELEKISICWGDAVFVDEHPFEQLLLGTKKFSNPVIVACAIDENPYAWFETTEQLEIKRAFFSEKNGIIEKGMHDQSLFAFNIDFAIQYLSDYKKALGIFDENINYSGQKEMKLLYSFEFLYNMVEYPNAKCIEIESKKVYSFNTKDELDAILVVLNKK